MKWTGAEDAILKATAYGYSVGDFAKDKIDVTITDGDNNIVAGLECGKILAAIDAIGDPVTSWLYFCYGAVFNRKHYENSWQALYAELFATVSDKKQRRYESVCRLALNNYRWRMWGREPFGIKEMSIVLNVRRDHWDRDWAKKLEKCMRVIDGWNSIGVNNVNAVLRTNFSAA